MSFNYEQSIWGKGMASLKWSDPTSFRLRQALGVLDCANPPPGREAGPRPSGESNDQPAVQLRVLEVGCGAGQFIRAVKKYRHESECYGADISNEALALARSVNDGVKYGLSNENTLPYEDAFFDVVLIFDVLEHVENPGAILSEVKRVLRPGGILYAFVPCEGDWTSLWHLLDLFGQKKNLTKKYAGHINYFTQKELRSLVEQREDPSVTRERDTRPIRFAPRSGRGSPSEGEHKRTGRFELIRVRYSEHVLGQLLGVIAFHLMDRAAKRDGKKQINNEAYFEGTKGGVINLIKKLVNGLVYLESTLLQRIPSPNVHLLVRKTERLQD